jgi:protein ImuB
MFACIYVPDFPVQALVRIEPALRRRAVAVIEGKPPLARVVALNERARKIGMEMGMTKLQAAIFAESATPLNAASSGHPSQKLNGSTTRQTSQLAMLRQRSHAQERSAHCALLDIAHAFAPRVEDTAADILLLDLAGLERLYGTAGDMAHDLTARVTSLGMKANVAIAPNPDAALHAARGRKGITLIAEGAEAQTLGALPVHILVETFHISGHEKTGRTCAAEAQKKLREQMLDTLQRWGIRDMQALGSLPENALAARLGEAGVKLRTLALGQGTRTLVLCAPAIHFEETMELECAVETVESLSFVLNRLLEQLCARLEARALAVQELRLRLQLEPRVAEEQTTTVQELAALTSTPVYHDVGGASACERTLRFPVAMRDTKVFLKLFQLNLAANAPGAPVNKIWIRAEPAPPRFAQRGMFFPVTPEAEKLEITLARIRGIVGEDRVGIAHLLDTHRPESFRLERFVVEEKSSKKRGISAPSECASLPFLAMRVFRPPCRLRVDVKHGRPITLTVQTGGEKRCKLQGDVVWAAGPWRCSGEWWADNLPAERTGPWDREEWDIVLRSIGKDEETNSKEDIALLRIYRDLASGDWFAEASYD